MNRIYYYNLTNMNSVLIIIFIDINKLLIFLLSKSYLGLI